MTTIEADLADITGGMAVGHYATDDDNFDEAVGELAARGHGKPAARKALNAWIDETPTWDCDVCTTEYIEVDGWADCPNCGAPNPDTISTDDPDFVAALDEETEGMNAADLTDSDVDTIVDNMAEACWPRSMTRAALAAWAGR